MDVKKIAMWIGGAILAVVVGLAVINRAKVYFPMIEKVTGK